VRPYLRATSDHLLHGRFKEVVRIQSLRTARFIQLPLNLIRKLEFQSSDIVVELSDFGCADQHRADSRPVQHPVKCDLCRRTFNLLRRVEERVQNLPIALIKQLEKAWVTGIFY